jgi:type I restriction enzyme S subunit
MPLTIGDLIHFEGGSQPPLSTFSNFPHNDYVRLLQIRDYKTDRYLTFIPNKLARKKCNADDIMIGRYGPPIFQILNGLEGAYNVALIKAVPSKELSPKYALQFLKQKCLFFFIEKLSQRSGGQTGIDIQELKKYPFPFPPTKTEQTAIAEALNDTDALIIELEKLIAKKRNIKHGAMQKLLKPKDGWDWTTVEILGKSYGGLSGKSKSDFKDGNCPYIPFMDIMSNPIIDKGYMDYVKISASESQNKARKGDLFFNGSSETPEEVGMCSVLLDDIPNLYLNSFCFGFRLNKELNTDGQYLTYYFRSNYGRKIFYILAQGATRHNLSKSSFLKIEFQIPKPEEQTRIAQILSDMDAEIEALEKKLDKYKMLKQGMMQNLLTGRIRLI